MARDFDSFSEFYAFYLTQHSTPGCRRMHVVGSAAVLAVLAYALLTASWWWLLALPVIGYGMAWTGHAAFEKNRPATFGHPFYSLAADWVMFRDVLVGRIEW